MLYSLAIQEVHERPEYTVCILSHRGPCIGGRVPWASHLAQDVSHLSHALINPHLETTHVPPVWPSSTPTHTGPKQLQLLGPTRAHTWCSSDRAGQQEAGKMHKGALGGGHWGRGSGTGQAPHLALRAVCSGATDLFPNTMLSSSKTVFSFT